MINARVFRDLHFGACDRLLARLVGEDENWRVGEAVNSLANCLPNAHFLSAEFERDRRTKVCSLVPKLDFHQVTHGARL